MQVNTFRFSKQNMGSLDNHSDLKHRFQVFLDGISKNSNVSLSEMSQRTHDFLCYLNQDFLPNSNTILSLDRHNKMAFFSAIQQYNSAVLFQNDSDRAIINIDPYCNGPNESLFKVSKILPHLKEIQIEEFYQIMIFQNIFSPESCGIFETLLFIHSLDSTTFTSPIDIKDTCLNFMKYKQYSKEDLDSFIELNNTSSIDLSGINPAIRHAFSLAISDYCNDAQTAYFSRWPVLFDRNYGSPFNNTLYAWQGVLGVDSSGYLL